MQNLETEIGSMNEWINEIYYQEIKKYDVGSTEFEAKLKQKLLTESKIYMESGCMTGMENVFGSQMNFGTRKCKCRSDSLVYTG